MFTSPKGSTTRFNWAMCDSPIVIVRDRNTRARGPRLNIQVLLNPFPFDFENEMTRTRGQLELQIRRQTRVRVILSNPTARVEDLRPIGNTSVLIDDLGEDLLKDAHLGCEFVVPQ